MSNVGIFMGIFGLCVFLMGLYMATGHKLGMMEGRAAFQNLSIDEWKRIGKYTIFSSSFILLISILAFIFQW
jgi:hypothetical protein